LDPNLGFDVGVLEISTDGGNTFQDILAFGGSFVMGGYNRTNRRGSRQPHSRSSGVERRLKRLHYNRGECPTDAAAWQAALADGE